MMRIPTKPIEDQTPHERLTGALYLALTAPTDALTAKVGEIADWLARDLSEAEIEDCKAIALKKWRVSLG